MYKIQVLFGYAFLTSILFWPLKLALFLIAIPTYANLLPLIISYIIIVITIKVFPHPTDHSNFAAFEMVKRFPNF